MKFSFIFKLVAASAALAAALSFAACSRLGGSSGGIYKDTRVIMGTYITITAAGKGLTEEQATRAINAGFAEVTRVDELMSTYKPQSQLSEVNREAGIKPVKVDPEVIEDTEQALATARATGGAFDPTIGPLVSAWKIGGKDARIPTQAEIDKARALVDYRQVVVDRANGTVFLKKKGMSLDLGGVAKGYASDRAVEAMKKAGVKGGIVACAGDIRAFGTRPDGSPWGVGIQHPRDKDAVIARVELRDAAISTSGDYERYFIKDGVRYHHILDPRTGYPARGLMSLTVIAKQSWKADSMTKMFVMGPEKAKAFAAAHPEVEVLMVDSQGKIFGTGRFAKGLPKAIPLEK